MSARRLVIPGVNLAPGEIRLTREAARHARVMRLGPGDLLEICDGSGRQARGKILSLSRQEMVVHLSEEPIGEPAAKTSALPVTLVQGLPKGEKTDLILQKATELGVSRVILAHTTRAVPRPQNPEARLARWQKIAREAARQCGRYEVPEVLGVLGFEEALKEAGSGLSLLLDECAQEGLLLREHLRERPEAVTLVVGPEGGLTEEERRTAWGMGFLSASLGKRILRTETAGLAVLAILQHLYGDLG